MKITEKELRSIIESVIAEGHEAVAGKHMAKAQACCDMDRSRLFDLCAKICRQNMSMSSLCDELCACVRRGDIEGCCSCLDEICTCMHCERICEECCGC